MASKDPHRSEDRDGPLADYRRKRDFARTPEPPGTHAPGTSGDTGRFVVQIHDATRTHFDFRLEVDGVLKSWAVPKGPTHDPAEKRLAVPTEDHPLDYRDFEGVIAPGEYGGGTVIVWDQGTYRSMATDRRGNDVPFADALAAGHASFWMDGAKLHGGYALTRTRGGPGRGETWLLVKRKDRHAAKTDAPDPWRARSVLTGRTLRQVAAESDGAAGPDQPD
ncbi:3'-phosphoesterase [Yinghuangia sp. ASG 101]|uniref:DNA polymerase ligase N-terminal domain-containing protein n=1 Tax=Yinghuangia sp. ASG 101 TaxID=2896848 RepID=UPI001E5C736A|nr:DNA polymerase ligase N-terminal domain-containing protein [Yinghuangia sp. ASG 101]UGQ13019.1 3'-phosphoesterase [Yinghuangia sp. ASG 101]